MATTKRDDVPASESAEIGAAQKRSVLSLQESAGRPEILSQDALDAREAAIKPTRRQAGPELVAPDADDGLGQESLRPGAPEVDETDLENPDG